MTDVRTPAEAAAGDVAGRIDASLLGSLLAAVVAGGGLALAGRAGALVLLVAIAVVQALFTCTWVFGTGMPGRKGALVLATLAAGAADATVSVWPHGRLGTLVAVLGLAVAVMFVHQLARGAARTQIVSSLSAVSLLVVGVVALPALLQLRHEFADGQLAGRVVETAAAAVAAALVAGCLVDLVLPAPRFDAEVPRGLLAVLASAVVGAAVGYLLLTGDAEFTGGRSAFIGAALGALAGLLSVGAAFVLYNTPQPPNRAGRALRPALIALLPLCMLAPAAFLLYLTIRV